MFGYWQYGTESLVEAERSCREFVGASVAVHIDGFGEPWPITWHVPTIAELESANLAEGRAVFGGHTSSGSWTPSAPRGVSGCCRRMMGLLHIGQTLRISNHFRRHLQIEKHRRDFVRSEKRLISYDIVMCPRSLDKSVELISLANTDIAGWKHFFLTPLNDLTATIFHFVLTFQIERGNWSALLKCTFTCI